MLDPDEWTYVAEGGKHAVFSFCAKAPETDVDDCRRRGTAQPLRDAGMRAAAMHEGRILRIAKSDLAGRAAAKPETDTASDCPRELSNDSDREAIASPDANSGMRAKHVTAGESVGYGRLAVHNGDERARNYLDQIVAPRLGRQYVDIPTWVQLSPTFVYELYSKTMRSNVIPPHRLKSWQNSHAVASSATAPFITATLLRDYTKMTEVPFPDNSQESRTPREAQPQHLHDPSPSVSVEIKPKAGYLSLSPLVHPRRRCKLRHTRYEINQQLMAEGHLRRGWGRVGGGSGSSAVSRYDPRDLFSGDELQIRSAIERLMENAQNNLRVFRNGGRVPFGRGGGDIAAGRTTTTTTPPPPTPMPPAGGPLPPCAAAARPFPGRARWHPLPSDGPPGGNEGGGGGDNDETRTERRRDDEGGEGEGEEERPPPRGEIVDVVAAALAREPLLRRLATLQRLDVVDADGAAAVFRRLAELCGDGDGGADEAEELLDLYCCGRSAAAMQRSGGLEEPGGENGDGRPADAAAGGSGAGGPAACDVDVDESPLAASPYGRPPACPALEGLLGEISSFRREFGRRQRGDDEKFLDASYLRASRHVGELSKEACLFLLGNWLLSLAMCDVSVFVAFRRVDGPEKVSGDSRDSVPAEPGWSFCQINNGQVSGASPRECRYAYAVKVIDCDPKPARKLRDRDKVESLVEHFRSR